MLERVPVKAWSLNKLCVKLTSFLNAAMAEIMLIIFSPQEWSSGVGLGNWSVFFAKSMVVISAKLSTSFWNYSMVYNCSYNLNQRSGLDKLFFNSSFKRVKELSTDDLFNEICSMKQLCWRFVCFTDIIISFNG